MTPTANTLLLLITAIVAFAIFLRLVTATTVFEYERGLKFANGRLQGVLGPGRYWHRLGTTVIQRIDTRPSRVIVAGQEVLSADGVAIKASIAATVQITDVERAVMGSDNYHAAIHTELQLALRAIASALPIEELLQKRADIPAELKKTGGPALAAIGIELQDASLRDPDVSGRAEEDFRAGGQGAAGRPRGAREGARGDRGAAQPGECGVAD